MASELTAGERPVASPAGADLETSPSTYEWRVEPWRREPRKAAITTVIILAVVFGAWWYGGRNVFPALLAMLILWGSLGPFFVSSRFVIDDSGVEVDSPFLKRRRAWSDIRSYYVDGYGATLSPFLRHSWLEAYRSIRVLFGDHESAVRELLAEKLGQPAGRPSA